MPGKSSVASSSFFNQSEDAKASGFSNAIQSPWHLFTAKLFAYAKPVFLHNSITLNLLLQIFLDGFPFYNVLQISVQRSR